MKKMIEGLLSITKKVPVGLDHVNLILMNKDIHSVVGVPILWAKPNVENR